MERFTQQSFRKVSDRLEQAPGINQKYLVIVNPISRGGKALREGVWLLRRLGRLGVQHEAFFTESPGHGERIVKRGVDGVDVVVAVGGDGTVNEVINGMMSVPERDKPLAVFPAGTADDFCHNVGIPRDRREKALEILLGDSERRIDLLKFNDRFAVVQLGVGGDAEVAYHTLSHKKIRVLAYFAVGLRIVFKERMRETPKLIHIESDTRTYDGKFLVAVFGNAPLYGRYVYWMPDAKMDDGIVNMSALRPMSPIPAWILLMRCFNKDFRSDRVLYDAGTRFYVELKEDSFLQVDGEVYKYKAGEKLDVTVAREALKVRLPPPAPDGPFSKGISLGQ